MGVLVPGDLWGYCTDDGRLGLPGNRTKCSGKRECAGYRLAENMVELYSRLGKKQEGDWGECWPKHAMQWKNIESADYEHKEK